MGVAAQRVTVTDVAVQLSAAATTDHVVGHSVLLTNRHATDAIDIGPAGVTSGNGYSLRAGESITVDLAPGEDIFGIAAALGSVRVDVLRLGI